jgi:chloramphenicol-sensitive protein RarD
MLGNQVYFFSGLMSFIIWGFLPLFFKQIESLDSVSIAFYRVIFSALVMFFFLIFILFRSRKISLMLKKLSTKDILYTIFFTFLGAAFLDCNWVSYVYTVNHISIHTAAFSYMIVPIMTAFLAIFILKEKINKIQALAILLSCLSCYFIGHVSLKEVIFILIISLSYSLFIISQRKNNLLPRQIILAFQMLMAAGIMLVIQLFMPVQHFQILSSYLIWHILFISVFFTLTPLFLNLFAMNGMKASQLAFLIYLNPIISFIIGIMLYGEKISPLSMFSYALLSIAIFVFNWEWFGNIFPFLKQKNKLEKLNYK